MKFLHCFPLLLCITACSEHKFSSLKECTDYVRMNSATNEKLRAGVVACRAIFNTLPDQPRHAQFAALGQCVINDFSQINDDQSGTRVVSNCGSQSGAMNMARVIARHFSQSHRVAEALESQQ